MYKLWNNKYAVGTMANENEGCSVWCKREWPVSHRYMYEWY